MVFMDKDTAFRTAFILFAIILILTGIIIFKNGGYDTQTGDAPDENGTCVELNATEKAISIVLNDTKVKAIFPANFSISHKSAQAADELGNYEIGYLNGQDNLYKVQISGRSETDSTVYGYRGLTALVDTDSEKVMVVTFGLMRGASEPEYAWAIIPPGATFYQLIPAWYPFCVFNLTYEPEDAKVYPIIVLRINGSSFEGSLENETFSYTHRMTNITYTYDGTVAVKSGWSVPVDLYYEGAYLAIRNGDESRDIHVMINYRDRPDNILSY